MPERDGLELIREVRRRFARLPIVAVSGGMQDHQALPSTAFPDAFSPEGVLKIAQVFGASRTLAKPFRLEDLRAAALALVGPAGAS
jgi:CheY-like chemotaxis protein